MPSPTGGPTRVLNAILGAGLSPLVWVPSTPVTRLERLGEQPEGQSKERMKPQKVAMDCGVLPAALGADKEKLYLVVEVASCSPAFVFQFRSFCKFRNSFFPF